MGERGIETERESVKSPFYAVSCCLSGKQKYLIYKETS